jgi:hypothetical protein
VEKSGNVQESCINSQFDIDVEESASEPQPEKKKTFNLGDPEDMKRAKEIADKALERLRKEDPE